MGKPSNIDVKKVAILANLPLDADEERIYAEQLSKVLDYVELLDKADTTSVHPTYNASGNKNALREDKVKESLSQEEALSNTTKKKGGFFISKGVFEE